MNIEIRGENAVVAAKLAQADGFHDVSEYINVLIQRDADLHALKEGIADAEAGNVSSFREFDLSLRKEMGFAAREAQN